MGFFRNLVAGAANTLEVKTICSGADLLISRHTNLNIAGINSDLRKHADELIKSYVLNDTNKSFNEATAALFKLAVIYKNFEIQDDTRSMEVIAISIRRLRDAVNSSIRPDISLYVMGETGC